MESNHILDSKKAVSEYLQFYPSKKTKENYRNAIYQYLSIFYEEVPTGTGCLDEIAGCYLNELKYGRHILTDLRIAATSFANRYSPLTGNLNLTLVCAWLEYCGVYFQKRERQRVFNVFSPVRPVRKEAELTRSLFRNVYSELPEHIGVLLLVLLGSGMRLGEAMSLKREDVDWKLKHTAIHIRAENTKTKTERTTYLTTEAKLALQNYLSHRSDKDPRIFPYSQATAQYYFRKAADRAGYGKTCDSPRLIHWHMTRKWFISRFSLYASKEVAEELAGHEGYLAISYQRFTKRQILHQFRRAEKYLSLFPEQPKQR